MKISKNRLNYGKTISKKLPKLYLMGDINKFQTLNSRIAAHMDRIQANRNILDALLV